MTTPARLALVALLALASMAHVTLHTPRDPSLSAGLACFEVAGLSLALAPSFIASASCWASFWICSCSLWSWAASAGRALSASCFVVMW